VADEAVRFTNLDGFARALRKVDRDLARELRLRMLDIAKDVAVDARGRLDFKHPSGAAKASIKARATTRGARIEAGGSKVPYYPWLDFGGRVGRNESIERKVIPGGRYIYPAIASNREEIEREMVDALTDVAHKAGFKTRKGF